MTSKVFDGQYAFITGARKGIGRDIALSLANEGCNIAFCYRSDDSGANDLRAEIERIGVTSLPIKGDVGDEISVISMFEEIGRTFGNLDILVNNAGVTRDNLIVASTVSDIRKLIDTNLMGTILCSREAIKYMLPKKRGVIINLSSISASQANKGQTIYAATKGGVEAFTRALAVEYGRKGIRVNAIAPGVIETEMTLDLLKDQEQKLRKRILSKRLGKPSDISLAVNYLAHPDNDYITGEVLNINGGLSLS